MLKSHEHISNGRALLPALYFQLGYCVLVFGGGEKFVYRQVEIACNYPELLATRVRLFSYDFI